MNFLQKCLRRKFVLFEDLKPRKESYFLRSFSMEAQCLID